MRDRLCAALAGVALAAVPAAAQQRCEDLTRLSLPNVNISLAMSVPAGKFVPPGETTPIEAPVFCRVAGVVVPEVKFELWMPAAWNRKLMAVGNGGLAGSVNFRQMAEPLQRGYATGSTDTGHEGRTNDASWALGHTQRIFDFAYRSIHAMAQADKAIIDAFYGAGPAHSYFSGCSQGGQEALMSVQRYPQDFDGVIAGDPANWLTRHYTASHMWVTQALEGDAWLSPAKVQVLADAVISTCDVLDGVKDGVINDPRRCRFDPASIVCKSGESLYSNCLTAPQVEAVKKIWNGPRDAEGGVLYPGLERGSEGGPTGWLQWVTGREPGTGGHTGLGLPFMKYIVYENPEWDFRTFRYTAPYGLESDVEYVEDKVGRIFDAIDPDLRPFRAHGGKLIQYHGWADPDIPPMNSVNYYQSVVRTVGGSRPDALRDTKDFYRLFLVPGMNHCGGGAGTSRFDALSALEQWSEHDKAPDELAGSHVTGGQVDRTRPICAYPMEAKYKGSGSTDDASNFVCSLP